MRAFLRKQYWLRRAYYAVIANPVLNANCLYKGLLTRKIRRIHERGVSPGGLSIEVTTICNAQCGFCPNHELPAETMDLELFKSIATQARALGVKHLTLTGVGETLLDKRFFERLDFLRELDFDAVSFFTNGSLMDDKRAARVIDSPVTNVIFSIDSVDPEKYWSLRKLKFDQVDRNLKALSKRAKGRIQVSVSSVHEKGNSLEEIKAIYRRYHDSGVVDLVTFVPAHNWGMDGDPALAQVACDYLWHNMFVRADGRMVICCLDWRSEMVLGDLRSEPLAEVVHGKLKTTQETHLAGERGRIPICSRCTHIPDWWVVRHGG
ncbi:radical SAM/SPASM domain-containing protein [Planctomycetota bacterium]